jgi:transposase InsO family protein
VAHVAGSRHPLRRPRVGFHQQPSGSDGEGHHFEIIYSTVARPQGRGKIERFFGSVNTELLTELPGHLTRGHPPPAPVLTLKELDTAICRFITENHQREHPRSKTPRIMPG